MKGAKIDRTNERTDQPTNQLTVIKAPGVTLPPGNKVELYLNKILEKNHHLNFSIERYCRLCLEKSTYNVSALWSKTAFGKLFGLSL